MYYQKQEGNQYTGSILPVSRLLSNWEQAFYSNQEIKMPIDAINLVAARLAEYPYEVGCVIYLSSWALPICVSVIGRGNKSETTFDVRQVAQMGLMCDASMFILMHNHPNYHVYKSLAQSEEDFEVTKSIAQACSALGMYCFDSIIVNIAEHKGHTTPCYRSMRLNKTYALNIANGFKKPKMVSFEKAKSEGIPWVTADMLGKVRGCWEEGSILTRKETGKEPPDVYIAQNDGELGEILNGMKAKAEAEEMEAREEK